MSTMDTMIPTHEVYSHPLTPEQKANLLTAVDRCDACGGQAYFIAKKDGFPLLFCRHHYMKNEMELAVQGFQVIDQSFLLFGNVNPLENKQVY